MRTHESQIKHTMVNQLKEDSREVLGIPEVRERLGGYTNHLETAVENSFSVDIDDDGFLVLEGHSLYTIPIVARHIGERAILHARDSGMNPKQILSASRLLGSSRRAKVAAIKTADHFTENSKHKELPLFHEQPAVTSSNYWQPGDSEHVVWGRPFLSMNIDTATKGRLSPVIFLHELTHVLQGQRKPIEVSQYAKDSKRRSQRELEAFYVAGQIVEGFKDAGRQKELLDHTRREDVDDARTIEAIRKAYQSPTDPFEPNEQIAKKLTETGKDKLVL